MLTPLVLDEEEAVALAVALQVMPARLRRRVEAVHAMTVTTPFESRPTLDPDVLTTAAQAAATARACP